MAVYNVTNQVLTALDTRLNDTKTTLETRRALWNKLSPEKRQAWIAAGTIPDPILDRLWKLYLWLKAFFGEA